MKAVISFLVLSLFIAGCGEDRYPLPTKSNNDDNNSINNPNKNNGGAAGDLSKIGDLETAVVGEAKNLKQASKGAAISGTGTVRLKAPRPDEDSKTIAKFKIEDGGKVVLISNSNTELSNGLKLIFERTGSTLKFSVDTVNGSNFNTVKGAADKVKPLAMDPTVELSVEINTHGDHGHFKIKNLANNQKVNINFLTQFTGAQYLGFALVNASMNSFTVVDSEGD